MQTSINRAYTLSSTDYHLKEELHYPGKAFVERNNYTQWLVKTSYEKRFMMNRPTKMFLLSLLTQLMKEIIDRLKHH